jgi:hypothetical protein
MVRDPVVDVDHRGCERIDHARLLIARIDSKSTMLR